MFHAYVREYILIEFILNCVFIDSNEIYTYGYKIVLIKIVLDFYELFLLVEMPTIKYNCKPVNKKNLQNYNKR